MAIKKKTKAQKDQDKKDLEKAQLALFEAAQAFQREVWECEWDLEWIRLKDLTDLFSKIRNVDWALDRSKATKVYTNYDDIAEKSNKDNYTSATYYKD